MKKLQQTPNQLIDSIKIVLRCQLSGDDAKQLGEGIAQCVTLTSLDLDLSENGFGETDAKYLGEGIAKCVTLTNLNFCFIDYSIGKKGAKY